MPKIIKLIKQDLQDPAIRFTYIWSFIRRLPGKAGLHVRNTFLSKHLLSCGSGLIVHPGVHIRNPKKMTVGNNVTLGVDTFIQAGGVVEIGDDVLLGPRAKIWSINHRYDNIKLPVRKQGYKLKKTIIGNDVWLGANSFIMPGAVLGDGVIVAAHSVVGAKKIPPNYILAGNPARKVGIRGENSGTKKYTEEMWTN